MGQSTNGILAFGVDLGEEIPKWLWKHAGVDETQDDPYPELEEVLLAQGLCLVMHCSGEYPRYLLAYNEQVAYSGHEVRKVDLTVPDDLSGWPKKAGKPAWLLCSLRI